MNELVSKISLMTKMYLNDDDFVAKQLLETPELASFLIVSTTENIEKLTFKKDNSIDNSFLKKMETLLQLQAKEIGNQEIKIEVETIDGRFR